MTFYWAELERQVRIEGRIKKLSSKESDAYFATRPRESQIGAYASNQSRGIIGRKVLDDNFEFYSKKFENKQMPPEE